MKSWQSMARRRSRSAALEIVFMANGAEHKDKGSNGMERRVALAAMVLTGVGALAALGIWLAPDFDPFDWREGKLVEPEPLADEPPETDDGSRYTPDGDGLPTVVSFKNANQNECLLQKVVFSITEKKPTPRRPTKAGALPALPVTFTRSHYDGNGRFELKFQEPQAVPGMEWATLIVSISERAWVGNTYVGKLTVFYNGNQSLTIKDVELDILD